MKYILAREWLRNLCFFICLRVALGSTTPLSLGMAEQVILTSLLAVMYSMAWLNNRILRRVVFEKGRRGPYFLALAAMLATMTATDFFANQIVKRPAGFPEWSFAEALLPNVLFLLVGFGLNAAYREIMRRQNALEQALLTKQNELRFLQNQVNPHFLFNSLNNLYSASLTEPEKVSSHILQMADLLRYQLSSSKKEFVPLAEEVDFLLNYLEIERRRIGQQVVLSVETTGEMGQKQIAPLLFLPFLENALKYSSGGAEPAEVVFRIESGAETVRFFVQNSLPKNAAPLAESTGIGIENARKRLELLYPKWQHLLVMEPKTDSFLVDLTIRFSEK